MSWHRALVQNASANDAPLTGNGVNDSLNESGSERRLNAAPTGSNLRTALSITGPSSFANKFETIHPVATSAALLQRIPLSNITEIIHDGTGGRPDVHPIHRLSAVVPSSSEVGAAVVTDGPEARTSSIRRELDLDPKSSGANYFEIYSPRVLQQVLDNPDMTVPDDTVGSSLMMNLSSLLSGILEEPSVKVGVAEGRAQMQEEAEIYRDHLHLHYRSEFHNMA